MKRLRDILEPSLDTAARRLRLGGIVVAALSLGAAGAVIEACRSAVEPSTPTQPLTEEPQLPIVVSVQPPAPAGNSPGEVDASSQVVDEPPSHTAPTGRKDAGRDAAVDARRGRPQDANVIYE